MSVVKGKFEMMKIVIAKAMKGIRVLVAALEAKKGTASTLKVKEYICFLIKSIDDAIKLVPSEQVLLALKQELFELVCTGAELEDIMVRNQCQQLFTYVLTQILDNKLAL